MAELPTWEGRSLADWALAWEVPRVHAFQSLDSTNDLARELALGGSPPGTVVIAEEQLRGRGRTGGSWVSPPGVGLWMSLLLPRWSGRALPLLPLLVGIGVARAIENLAGASPAAVQLKWPNDVLVAGRKVCGILCESVGGAGIPVVAGVGINVLQADGDFPPELKGIAGSLHTTLGLRLARGDLAGAVVRQVREVTRIPLGELSPPLHRAWDDRDALAGQRVMVTGAGEPRSGWARGVSPSGEFLLEGAGGETLKVHSGTVRFQKESDPAHEPRTSG